MDEAPNVSDNTPAKVQLIHPFSFNLFLLFLRIKNPLQSLLVFLTIFNKVFKLQSFEWLKSVSK